MPVGQKGQSLPLEGKVSAVRLTDEVAKTTIAFAIYTSPPPKAEPPLKGKPQTQKHRRGKGSLVS